MVAQEGTTRGEKTVSITAERLSCEYGRHSCTLNGLSRRDDIQRDDRVKINGVGPYRSR
jgi:hypothetical protein